MVIGEAPGAMEDKVGKPFVGRSGQLLRQQLREVPGTIIITNTVKCRPPKNRDPRKAEKQACYKYLQQELVYYNPDLVILVGRHASQTFLHKTVLANFTLNSGTLYKGKFIPIIHPASLLYNPKNKDVWEQGWAKIHAIIQEKLAVP